MKIRYNENITGKSNIFISTVIMQRCPSDPPHVPHDCRTLGTAPASFINNSRVIRDTVALLFRIFFEKEFQKTRFIKV